MAIVDFGLNDRVALVTGASRGIGEAIARGLAVYLASDISSFTTGSVFVSDGGMGA